MCDVVNWSETLLRYLVVRWTELQWCQLVRVHRQVVERSQGELRLPPTFNADSRNSDEKL